MILDFPSSYLRSRSPSSQSGLGGIRRGLYLGSIQDIDDNSNFEHRDGSHKIGQRFQNQLR